MNPHQLMKDQIIKTLVKIKAHPIMMMIQVFQRNKEIRIIIATIQQIKVEYYIKLKIYSKRMRISLLKLIWKEFQMISDIVQSSSNGFLKVLKKTIFLMNLPQLFPLLMQIT